MKIKSIETVVAENLQRLMQARPALGSNTKIAKAAKLGTGTVSRIRNADASVGIGNLQKVAHAFNVDIVHLMRDGGGTVAEARAPFEGGQIAMEVAQLLDDYNAVPDDLKEMIARKAAELRKYFDALPPAIRKNFGKPADPEKNQQWERDIEADLAGINFRDARSLIDAQIEALPAQIRKATAEAQEEIDKYAAKSKSGPRWRLIAVLEEDKK